MKKMIYLDNAATTYPKPDIVLSRMIEKYTQIGVSPGRGSYDLSAEAGELVNITRQKLAQFFGAPDPNRIIFASNATDALNTVIQGMLRPGDHAISSRLEHNSVLRPLNHLCQRGILEYDLIPFDNQGFIKPENVIACIRSNTRLVILSHVSNVLGTIQPIQEIGHCCAERGVPLFIDAAQSAGVIPIDMQSLHASGIIFTGHKSMLGPTGIGGLCLDTGIEIQPTRFGGTGIDSKNLIHTEAYPYRLECGTLNILGIIGLSEGLRFLEVEGTKLIYAREMELLTRLRDGLSQLNGIEMYCAQDLSNHAGILTINVQGVDPEDIGAILDADFNIAVRTGLHCAPLVHDTLGTSPQGGVRFSLGPFNTTEDIDQTISAMAEIVKHRKQC